MATLEDSTSQLYTKRPADRATERTNERTTEAEADKNHEWGARKFSTAFAEPAQEGEAKPSESRKK